MNKRGQGLTGETVAILILVVLVLIVIVIFFLGGFNTLSNKIKDVFSISTERSDIDIAQSGCQFRCSTAESTNNPRLFCDATYKINNQETRCWSPTIGVECPQVDCRERTIK